MVCYQSVSPVTMVCGLSLIKNVLFYCIVLLISSGLCFVIMASKMVLCISLLTHCIMVDSSTVMCWKIPFVILGVLGLFCCFYSIFSGKSC